MASMAAAGQGSTVFFRARLNFLPVLNLKLLHAQTVAIKRLAGYPKWDLQVQGK